MTKRVFLFLSLCVFTLSLSISQKRALFKDKVDFNQIEALAQSGSYDSAAVLIQQAGHMYFEGAEIKEHFKTLIEVAEGLTKDSHYKKADLLLKLGLSQTYKRFGKNTLMTRQTYHYLGYLNAFYRGMDSAIFYYKIALELDTTLAEATDLNIADDSHDLGLCLFRKWNATRDSSYFQQAISYTKDALEIRKRHIPESLEKMAMSFQVIGSMYLYKEDYDLSYKYLDSSLNIYLELDEITDSSSLANTYQMFAIYHLRLDNFHEGLKSLHKSRACMESYLGPNSPELATRYASLSSTYGELGELYKQKTYIQKAINLSEKNNLKSTVRLGNHYLHLGTSYDDLGDTQAAIVSIEHGMKIFSAELKGRNAINKLAFGHFKLGLVGEDWERKIKHAQQAVSMLEEIGQTQSSVYGASLNGLSVYYRKLKMYDQSLEYAKQAIHVYKEIGRRNTDLAKAYLNLSTTYYEKQAWDSALFFIKEAEKGFYSGKDSTGKLSANNLDSVFVDSDLITLARTKGDVLCQYYLNVTQDEKDLLSAKEAYDFAINVLDTLSYRILYYRSRQELRSKAIALFEKAIRLDISLFEKSKDSVHLHHAFKLMEKSKANDLRLMMQNLEAKKYADLPEDLFRREIDLRKSIIELESGDSEKNVVDELIRIREEYESIQKIIEREYPKQIQGGNETSIASIADIQVSLRNNAHGFVEYFVGEDQLFVFYITPNHFEVRSLGQVDEIERKVDSLLTLCLQGWRGNPESLATQYVSLGNSLFETLLKPILDNSDVNRLTIIPDGKLGYLPFDMLIDSFPSNGINNLAGLYLINQYTIGYGYSGSTMLSKRRSSVPTGKYIGFAPKYDGSILKDFPEKSPLFAGLDTTNRDNFSPLLANDKEIEGAQSLLGGKLFVGSEATVQKFKETIGNFDIVHLAMHAIVNETNPMYSGLVFYPDSTQSQSPNDSSCLYAYDLYGMDMNASLVILSACNSGTGQLTRGEGISSLGRVFRQSGSAGLVSSLWKANDQSTKEIVVNFAKYLKEGDSKSDALRRAKLAYLVRHQGLENQPFYLGHLVLYGIDSPINFSSGRKFQLLLLIVGLSVVVLVGIFYRKKKRTS